MNRLQLETADLRNSYTLLCHLHSLHGVRITDISNYKHLTLMSLHNLTKKCRGGRLSIRPRNSQYISPAIVICKLNFSPDQDPVRLHLLHNRKIHWNTRT